MVFVDILEWCGILPPPHTTRAVNGAVLATGVAVATAMGHALRPGVGIVVHVGGRAAGHGWCYGEVGVGWHSAPSIDAGSAEVVAGVIVVAGLVGDDGDRVRAGAVTSKSLDLGKSRVRREAGRLLGEHCSFTLSAESLLLGKSLLLLAHLAARSASIAAAA